MMNDIQWGMADKRKLQTMDMTMVNVIQWWTTYNGVWQIIVNDIQWEMTCNGEWHAMENHR